MQETPTRPSANTHSGGGASLVPGAATGSPRVTVLDGWRGLSILLVIVGHLTMNRALSDVEGTLAYRTMNAMATCGVCVFFVISGFIILKLAIREYDRNGHFSTVGFYTRRFFRIVPPFYLYLACVFLLGAVGLIDQPGDKVLLAATFTCNLPDELCGYFAGHSWSLAYEEQFYLLLPLLMWRPRLRVTVPALFVILLGMPYARVALHLGHVGFLLAHGAFYASMICAGALLAVFEGTLKSWSARHWAGLLTPCALLLLVGLTLLDAAGHEAAAPWRFQQARMLLNPTLEPLCIAWLVGSSVYRKSALTWLLNSAPMRFIGLISFSLYLWQQLFTGALGSYPVHSLLQFAPLMFVCATLSYYLIERPGQKIGKALTESRSRLQSKPA